MCCHSPRCTTTIPSLLYHNARHRPGNLPVPKSSIAAHEVAVDNHPYQHCHASVPRQAFSDLWLQRSYTRWQLSSIQVHLPIEAYLHTPLPTPPQQQEKHIPSSGMLL